MAENLGARFTIDVSQLRAGIAQANRLIRESESEFKKAAASMDDWSKSQEGLEKRLEMLNKTAELQEQKVSALKSSYNKLVAEGLDPTSAKAVTLRTEINKEEAALNKSRTEITKTTEQMDRLGDESQETGTQLSNVTSGAEKASGGFTVFKGVLADLVASAIKAAVSGLKELATAAVEAYKAVDKGSDNVIKATGATGEEAKQLEEAYKNVAKSIKGDFSDIGSVLGEVNTRFGFTGKTLEKATEQFLKFSEITGEDGVSAVQDVSKALEASGGNGNEYGDILDALAKASQKSGAKVGDLAKYITKNGATMRALGFDTKTTIALFAQLDKSGVDSEKVMQGLQKATVSWGKAGKNSNAELKAVIESIKNSTTSEEAAAIAAQTFGRASTEMADAIRSGRFAYSDFITELNNSKGTVDATYNETLDAFDQFDLKIQEFQVHLAELVAKIVEEHGPEIERILTALLDFAEKALPAIIEFIDAWIIGAKEISKTWEALKAVFGVVWSNVAAGATAAFNFVKTAAQGAWNGIKSIFSAVGSFFASVWNVIKTAFQGVGSFFYNVFKGAFEGIKRAFSKIGEFFGGIWDTIKEKFTVVGVMVAQAIGGAFKTAINAVITVIEGALNLIPAAINGMIELINLLPGVDIPNIPYVDLPRLAKGGIATQATGAIIGEAGDEAVLPLERNTGWMDMLAEKIAGKLGGSVTINQVNNYSQEHSQYEIYKSKQETVKAVKLALSQ